MANRGIKKDLRSTIKAERVICSDCEHFRGLNINTKVVTCDAFPNGIPHEMLKPLDKRNIDEECNKGVRFVDRANRQNI